MEARIARLESDVGHLRTDVAEIKVDKFDSLRAEIASAKVRALMLCVSFSAVMLGTMARGFGWL